MNEMMHDAMLAVAGDRPDPQDVMASLRARIDKRRSVQRLASMVAIATAVVAVFTATTLLWPRPAVVDPSSAPALVAPTDRSTVQCYATLSLTDVGNMEPFSVATKVGDPVSNDASLTAIKGCSFMWQQHKLSSTKPYVTPYDPTKPVTKQYLPVPPLTACIVPNGRVGVFPGNDGSCASLGLPGAKL